MPDREAKISVLLTAVAMVKSLSEHLILTEKNMSSRLFLRKVSEIPEQWKSSVEN